MVDQPTPSPQRPPQPLWNKEAEAPPQAEEEEAKAQEELNAAASETQKEIAATTMPTMPTMPPAAEGSGTISKGSLSSTSLSATTAFPITIPSVKLSPVFLASLSRAINLLLCMAAFCAMPPGDITYL